MNARRRRTAVKAVHVAVLVWMVTGMAPATGLAAPLPTAAPQESFLAGIPSWYLRRILPAFLRVEPEAVPVEDPSSSADELPVLGAEQHFSVEPAVDSSDLEQPMLQDDDTDSGSVVLSANERPSSDLFLRASVRPLLAFPGEIVTYTVVISSGARDLAGITLSKALPDQIEVLSAPGATYDGVTRELSWTVDELKSGAQEQVTFQARIAAGSEMAVIQKWFEAGATVSDGSGDTGEAKALTTILVGEYKTEKIGAEGGTIESLDGLVEIEVPAGAVTQTTEVRVADFPYSPYWQAPDPEWLAFFGLEVVGAERDALRSADGHTRFLKPLHVTVDLSERVGVVDPYVVQVDGTTGEMLEQVDFAYDEEAGLLTMDLQTFSEYGIPGVSPFPDDGSYFPYQASSSVSLFSGAFTYRYPIAVPPVPSGMAPNLALSYNNRGLDGIKGIVQSPSVGVGFGISDLPSIGRGVKTKRLGSGQIRWKYDNDFSLMLHGSSHVLILGEQTGTGCRYYTMEPSGLHIMRYNGLCGYDGGRPPDSETGEYWVVRTPDGTTYRMGYTTNSEHVAMMRPYQPELCTVYTCSNFSLLGGRYLYGYAGDLTGTVAYNWSTDLAWDVYSNTIEYHYEEKRRTDVEPNYDRATYPEWVAYGGNGAQGTPNCLRVDFGLRERKIDGETWFDAGPGDPEDFSMWQKYLVQTMTVSISEPVTGVCTNTEIHAQHVLTYDDAYWYTEKYNPEYVKEWLLKKIERYGQGGEAGGHQLPPVRFYYTELRQFAFDETPYLRYDRIDEIRNGYGGKTLIDYERLQFELFYEFSYRVESEREQDGLGRTRAITYTYDGPCPKYGDGCLRTGAPAAKRLFGHEETTEDIYGYDGERLATIRHEFSVDDDGDLGRETYTEVKLADGTIVVTTTNSYSVITDCLGIEGQFCIYPDWTQSCQDGSCRKVEYEYDIWGNPLAQYDYGDPTVSGDERSIHRVFYTNTVDWILSKPAFEHVYDVITGDVGGPALVLQTRYFYDNAGSYAVSPTVGSLTRVDTGLADWGWVSTTQQYDNWGYVTVVTDTLGRTTTTEYDSVYHQFPVTACNALTQCAQTEFYGVNGPGLTTNGAYFGAAYRTWGPNGEDTATMQRYDGFGRITATVRPGDSWTYPTVWFEYDQGDPSGSGPGLWGEAHQREESGSAGTIDTYVYHDGLGRLIQKRAEAGSGQWVVYAAEHDSLGQVVKGFLPRMATTSTYEVATGSYATTEYDALGRVTVVTNTDGTSARTFYQGWKTASIDAEGHQTIYESDAWGRLVNVREFTGTYTGSPGWTDTPYAVTTYTYDVQGNLTDVWDAHGNHTQMAYDVLGRKTWMRDPGMGEWYYGYDLGGNLTYQIDGNRQAINFYYDELNRLVGKTYDEGPVAIVSVYERPADLASYAVTYSYDSSAAGYGIGQRTGMAYDGGSASYGYDARGRVVTETRQFEGVGTYATTFSYDALDRVETTTYADGEVITQTYDSRGMADTLESSLSETFVTGSTYTATGQLTQLVFGNGQTTDFSYDSLSLRLERLLTGDQETLQDLRYDYDDVGNVTAITDTVNSNQKQTFGYDALDRLTNGATNAVGNGQYNQTYAYDELGNITDFDGRVYTYSTSALPEGWEVVTGTWEVIEGALDGEQSSTRGVILAPTRMTDGRIVVRMSSQSWEGAENGAILFDYQDTDNFRFAQMRTGANEWALGECVNGTMNHTVQVESTIANDTFYVVEVMMREGEVRLLVDGEYVASITYGDTFGSDLVGLSVHNSHTLFDDWITTVMSPTAGASFDFATSAAGWEVTAGTWSVVSGVYSGAQAGAQALSMIDGVTLSDGWISGTIETQSGYLNGHLVFGYRDSDNFASVCLDDYGDRWRIIEWQSGAARVLAETSETIATDTAYNVQAVVRGGEVAMVADGDHKLGSRVPFDAGQAGLRVWGGTTHFDNVTVAPMIPLTTSIETFPEQPHAVKAIQHATGVDRYEYDANGNMTLRVELSGTQPITYYQEFDIENHLTAVTVTDGITQSVSRFAYDGDGVRAKRVAPDGAETVYLGQYFEVQISGGSSVTTSYYYHAGRRVAMRTEGEVYYLYGDHLGSTSLTTDNNGNNVVRQLYHPYGTLRWSSGSLPTDFTFTGQRNDSCTQLTVMGARWYSPQTARWISADTIVPDPANPQSLNRYSYVGGNPLTYIDPTGHQDIPPVVQQAIDYFTSVGWDLVGDPSLINPYWNGPDLVFTRNIVHDGVEAVVTLAVELKDVAGSVNLGTLSWSDRSASYGGSIERLESSTRRFSESSRSQLKAMCQAVYDALKRGTLQNALFTSSRSTSISDNAQAQFNGVYRATTDGGVEVLKPLTHDDRIARGAAAVTALKTALSQIVSLAAPATSATPFLVWPSPWLMLQELGRRDPGHPMWWWAAPSRADPA